MIFMLSEPVSPSAELTTANDDVGYGRGRMTLFGMYLKLELAAYSHGQRIFE